MTGPTPVLICCAGGCGKKAGADEVEPLGWSFLHITGRWRCGDCERELLRAAHAEGAPPRVEVDTLPPHSLGALKQLPERAPLREGVKP